MTYTADNSTITVTWKDYIDDESDIDMYQVSLWMNSSCSDDSTESLMVDWIELTKNYTQYSFVELQLQVSCQWKRTFTSYKLFILPYL